MKDEDTARKPLDGRTISVTLDVTLARNSQSDVYFSPRERESSTSFGVEGIVCNTESVFKSRRCDVTFYSDSQRHSERNMELAHKYGLESACGSVKIAPNLGLESFFHRGEEIVLNPITVIICLSEYVYSRTENLVRLCAANDFEAVLSLVFSYKDTGQNHSMSAFIELSELDLAVRRIYPIVGFHLKQRPQRNKKALISKA